VDDVDRVTIGDADAGTDSMTGEETGADCGNDVEGVKEDPDVPAGGGDIANDGCEADGTNPPPSTGTGVVPLCP
jgi:hypothetical protein